MSTKTHLKISSFSSLGSRWLTRQQREHIIRIPPLAIPADWVLKTKQLGIFNIWLPSSATSSRERLLIALIVGGQIFFFLYSSAKISLCADERACWHSAGEVLRNFKDDIPWMFPAALWAYACHGKLSHLVVSFIFILHLGQMATHTYLNVEKYLVICLCDSMAGCSSNIFSDSSVCEGGTSAHIWLSFSRFKLRRFNRKMD